MQAPPLRLLLAYRLLGWRLGPHYREWVHQDVTRPGYVLRQGAPVVALLGLALTVATALGRAQPQRVALPVLAVLALLVVLRRGLAERALRQQGVTADGRVDAAAQDWYGDDRARRQRNRSSATATVLLVAAALVLLAR